MSDDLMKRAREAWKTGDDWEAMVLLRPTANRIEELEAKLAQQDERVQAAVAAALREAAECCTGSGTIAIDGPIAAKEILALITPDAQAALDRAVAAERERFAKMCAEVVQLFFKERAFDEEWHMHELLATILEGVE